MKASSRRKIGAYFAPGSSIANHDVIGIGATKPREAFRPKKGENRAPAGRSRPQDCGSSALAFAGLLQPVQIPINQCLLLVSSPSLELSLTANSRRRRIEGFAMHEFNGVPMSGVCRAFDAFTRMIGKSKFEGKALVHLLPSVRFAYSGQAEHPSPRRPTSVPARTGLP